MTPGELGMMALGAIAAGAVLGGWRRTGWAALAGVALWAAAAALVRDDRAFWGALDYPPTEWAGWVAMYLAAGARAAWVGATVVALVVGASALPWGRERRRALPVGIAAASCAVAALGAPVLLASALALGLGAAVATRSARDAVVPVALGGASAWFGATAARYQVAMLASPADLAGLDAAVAASVVAGAAAALAVGWAAVVAGRERDWMRLGAPLAVVALAGAMAGLEARAGQRGPAPELAALADRLPRYLPELAARVPGGCLVDEDGSIRTVGTPPQWSPVDPCPSGAGPGRFPADQIPLLALSPSAPVTALTGWHAPEVGSVRLLVRMDDGVAMRAWRVSSLEIPVWSGGPPPPPDPLPGAHLVFAEGGRVRVASVGRVEDADPVEVVSRDSSVARLDVLIHPSAAPTVGALVELCGALVRAHPSGLRCLLATGDPGFWEARLGAAITLAPIDDDFPVVEAQDPGDFQ